MAVRIALHTVVSSNMLTFARNYKVATAITARPTRGCAASLTVEMPFVSIYLKLQIGYVLSETQPHAAVLSMITSQSLS